MKTIKLSGIALGLVFIVLLLTASIITRDGNGSLLLERVP